MQSRRLSSPQRRLVTGQGSRPCVPSPKACGPASSLVEKAARALSPPPSFPALRRLSVPPARYRISQTHQRALPSSVVRRHVRPLCHAAVLRHLLSLSHIRLLQSLEKVGSRPAHALAHVLGCLQLLHPCRVLGVFHTSLVPPLPSSALAGRRLLTPPRRVPFYGYIRLFFFLYLILPRTQGARAIYQDKIHPFLEKNEGSIDNFIASTHDRIKATGLTYFRRAVEYVKTHLLGLPPSEQPPSPVPAFRKQGYTQSLLARFSVPTARLAAAASTGNDVYNMLATAVSAAAIEPTGSAPGGRAMPSSGVAIPPHLCSSADKIDFIAAQREHLNVMLTALECEAHDLQRGGVNSPPGAFTQALQDPPGSRHGTELSKSRSETDFEKVEAESDAEEDDGSFRRRHVSSSGSGSWTPWAWGAGAGAAKSSSRAA